MVELLHAGHLPGGDVHRVAVLPSGGTGREAVGVEQICGQETGAGGRRDTSGEVEGAGEGRDTVD